jgi:glutaminyl-tRNA synthetase
VILIEQDDFMENPPNKFFRLGPGREVRLRGAYFVKCVDFTKDPSTGQVTELKCTYDPASRGGSSPDGRKVKGTIHWVSEQHSLAAEVRLYDRLFKVPFPGEEGVDFRNQLNPASLEVQKSARVERGLGALEPESRLQFERLGYFCVDRFDSKKDLLVFNRTVTLKDSWVKEKDQ